MDILHDVNFYKLAIAIFVPLAITIVIFLRLNKKNK
jgi:hypothetical protein